MSKAEFAFSIPESVSFQIVGLIRSEFKTKGAVPRQPNVIEGIQGTVVLEKTTEKRQWIRGLEEFSHLWVLFLFHANGVNKNRPIVHVPPGREVVGRGVFATRSPYRPNPIGLSVVRLLEIRELHNEIQLLIEGGDFLDMTPVIDIKPYIPYADCIPEAVGAWAAKPPTPHLLVEWTQEATNRLKALAQADFNRLLTILTDIIGHDPRPFHHRFPKKNNQTTSENMWSFHFGSFRIYFSVELNTANVVNVELEASVATNVG